MGMWFRGWYDPDRKKSSAAKLADALERFAEVQPGRSVELLMVGPALAADPVFRDEADRRGIPVEPAPFVPAHTIYSGWRDPNRDPEVGT